MIVLRNIDFRYPSGPFRLAFDQFAVGAGRSAAIIGPSGCGKTTLLHLIAGIIPCQVGTIEVNGTPVHTLGDRERRLFRIRNVGFVFQDFALLDYLSFYDNILHPFRINPAQKLTRQVKARARRLADRLGISEQLNSYVAQSSQGEQQRAAICRALLAEPAVILADEPTGNLDPANKQSILDILMAYAHDHGATLLVVTHDHALLDVFDQVCDFQSLSA